LKKIPLSRPSIDQSDIDAVVEILRSGWLTSGPKCEEFEREFAKYVGAKCAVALNSCTAALHLALKCSGISRGDEVIVPSLTFPTTANAALYQEAIPVFAEVDAETYNIDPNKLEDKLSKKTRAIIPVHISGNPCEMDPILEIAKKYDLVVVEDAAESLGSEYHQRRVGSFGIGCFSFFPTKNITTGEGGMLTTNDPEIAEKAKMMRGHGIAIGTWAREASRKPWERVQTMLGYNYRMTDFQAALGLSQLRRVNRLNEKRITHAAYLSEHLESIQVVTQKVLPKCKHVYQMYTPRLLKGNRDALVAELRKKGLDASVHFNPPVHLQPYYTRLFGFKGGELPTTEEISRTIFTLPMFPELTSSDLERIVNDVRKAQDKSSES